MNFGETIPVGFVLKIRSWENDGDHYNTLTHIGLTKVIADFLIQIAGIFTSVNNSTNPGFGNDEFKPEVLNIINGFITPENEVEVLEFLRFDPRTDTNAEFYIQDIIRDFVTDYTVEYTEYMRVVESIELYYNPTEFKIPELDKISDIIF